MPVEKKLIPAIPEITEPLSELAREQKRLRKLLALAMQARDDAERFSRSESAPADRKGAQRQPASGQLAFEFADREEAPDRKGAPA
jgi:hypothetical protein